MVRLMRPLPRSLGFGAISPLPTGPSSSSSLTPATPSESFRGHRPQAAAAIRSSRTRRRWTPRETVDGLRSANTTSGHPVSRVASQCATTAGLHPSSPSHTRPVPAEQMQFGCRNQWSQSRRHRTAQEPAIGILRTYRVACRTESFVRWTTYPALISAYRNKVLSFERDIFYCIFQKTLSSIDVRLYIL